MNNSKIKIIFLSLLLINSSIGCKKSESSPTEKDWTLALSAIYFNVDDICIRQYGTVSPLAPYYAANLFSGYPETCENAIIGNSTMDIGRQVPNFYDPKKTNNYGIGGNTACDMLIQMQYIRCHPKNVIIASADGNGVLRSIPPEISKETIEKIIARAKERWKARVVLVGIHPIKLQEANQRKNIVNNLIKNSADCYIDMVKLFGFGINDLAPDNLMADQIHYKEPVYSNLKNQILTQCGVAL
jgi:hypothetical protein